MLRGGYRCGDSYCRLEGFIMGGGHSGWGLVIVALM